MITPSISQRDQRAHENLSRGRRRPEKKKKKMTIALATRADTSHSDYEIKKRKKKKEEKTTTKRKKKKKKTNFNTRHAGIHLAQQQGEEKKYQKNTALATQAYASHSDWKYKEKLDYNTRHRSDLRRKQQKTVYSRTGTGRDFLFIFKQWTIGFALGTAGPSNCTPGTCADTDTGTMERGSKI